MKKFNHLILLLISFVPSIICGQNISFTNSVDFEYAIRKGSRTNEGIPGAKYFQNQVDYAIDVKVDPDELKLYGKEKIIYTNNSNKQLKFLVFRFYNDLFNKGQAHYAEIEGVDIGKEVELISMTINGEEAKKIVKRETIKYVYLETPIAPHSEAEILVEWNNFIPEKTHIRGGVTPEGGIYAAYWYPQIAVYDDLFGWDHSKYTGIAEFYNEFGNFSVNIEVPKNYIVWATGELQNGKEVLAPAIYKKYMQAQAGEKMMVVGPEDRAKQNVTANQDWVKYHFSAQNVNDFTFGLSKTYNWEAQSIPRGPNSSKRVLAQAAYAPNNETYIEKGLDYTIKSIEGLSKQAYEMDFPFPEMTIFQGYSGMESPMMVFQDSGDKKMNFFFLTSHEIGHSYFPMYVGINENQNGWIDEGFTTLMPTEFQLAVDSSYHAHEKNARGFARFASGRYDASLSTACTTFGNYQSKVQAYTRASTALRTLRSTLGKEVFMKAVHTFIENWKYKHPRPEDLIYTFEKVSGQDLDWFFVPWIQMQTYADLSLVDFKIGKKNWGSITIVNQTKLPIPIALKITYKDGTNSFLNYKPDVWKKETSFLIPLQNADQISKLELGNKEIPDAFRKANTLEL